MRLCVARLVPTPTPTGVGNNCFHSYNSDMSSKQRIDFLKEETKEVPRHTFTFLGHTDATETNSNYIVQRVANHVFL